jgi:hypothetical protein
MIEPYLSLITSEHKIRPKHRFWLATVLAVLDADAGVMDCFDLDTAVGAQLDFVGDILGRKRELTFQPEYDASPVLDDDVYRLMLYSKVLQNQWDGTIPGMYSAWERMFPGISLTLADNQNMSMTAIINGSLPDYVKAIFSTGYVIPKPSGVHMGVLVAANTHADLTPYTHAELAQYTHKQIREEEIE